MDEAEAERKAREYLNYISNVFGGCITKSDLKEECLRGECWEVTYEEAGTRIKVTVNNKSGKVTEIEKFNNRGEFS